MVVQLHFSKNMLPYLRRTVWEVKNEEQTQEVKLTESLPDIGRILGAWGQPLIRSKEWKGSGMSVSGGVMAWILYAPEEGAAQCVETWIPFQIQWDFPQSQYDGTMRVDCLLRSMDARSLSARKMMVRAVVSVMGEAMEPDQTEWYQPMDVPKDVQLLHCSYPVRLPAEAGEKVITIDEELMPKSSVGSVRKILYCALQPELTDQKIMADKVVFHGCAKVSMLCECEDAQLQSCEFEIPFSQYAELEKEYDSHGISDVIPAVTNLETEIQENGALHLKAGLVGQYVVYDRHMLELVTDAYSTQREVRMEQQRLELPAILDMQQENLRMEAVGDAIPAKITDIGMLLSHPSLNRSGESFDMEIPGSFQLLGQDTDGNVRGANLRWEKTISVPADTTASVLARCVPKGQPQMAGNGCSGQIEVDMRVMALTDIPMVTELELGEIQQADENRPSLILRRMGDTSLWQIAKSCGSTVEKILEANGLTGEPSEDQLLLIPVV